MGNLGNKFLSNTWRVECKSSAGDPGVRELWYVPGRMAGNTFEEFWPGMWVGVLKGWWRFKGSAGNWPWGAHAAVLLRRR